MDAQADRRRHGIDQMAQRALMAVGDLEVFALATVEPVSRFVNINSRQARHRVGRQPGAIDHDCAGNLFGLAVRINHVDRITGLTAIDAYSGAGVCENRALIFGPAFRYFMRLWVSMMPVVALKKAERTVSAVQVRRSPGGLTCSTPQRRFPAPERKAWLGRAPLPHPWRRRVAGFFVGDALHFAKRIEQSVAGY